MKLFDSEGPVAEALTVLANLILLNWLFALCSLPLVTVGASLTALHHVVLQTVRKEDKGVVREFFKAFKSNFRQATAIWLILLAVGAVIAADCRIGARVLSSGALTAVLAASALLFALWMVELVYVFPMQARYDNPVKQTFKNAFLVGIGNLPNTLILAALTLAVPYLCYRYEKLVPAAVLLSLFILFSGLAYLESLLINRIFLKTFPEERQAQGDEEK